MYLTERLNLPIPYRCSDLARVINECSVKDLQDFFPTLVQSVFGSGPGGNNVGWGLRTRIPAVRVPPHENEYSILIQFFSSHGPMFELCYRLLNEQIKFDVPIDMLPVSWININKQLGVITDGVYRFSRKPVRCCTPAGMRNSTPTSSTSIQPFDKSHHCR